jgi:hypothetical protein
VSRLSPDAHADIKPTELGVKQDAGKLDASLLTESMMLALMAPEKHLSPVGLAAYRELERIEQAFLEDVVKVLEHGVRKYARDNWMHVPDWEQRYTAARNRHILGYLDGDDFDDESGLHHLAHAMCCELFLVHMRGAK